MCNGRLRVLPLLSLVSLFSISFISFYRVSSLVCLVLSFASPRSPCLPTLPYYRDTPMHSTTYYYQIMVQGIRRQRQRRRQDTPETGRGKDKETKTRSVSCRGSPWHVPYCDYLLLFATFYILLHASSMGSCL